jgi:hypothetical protein
MLDKKNRNNKHQMAPEIEEDCHQNLQFITYEDAL